jgi:hypothetical protein
MYRGDYFLVLESDRPERFQTPEELRDLLRDILARRPEVAPREVERFISTEEKALHLRDNYCDLDLGEGGYLQWYSVRLEK